MIDYVLPRLLEPFADESFPGFVTRLAESYRFHDPKRLFRRLRPPGVTLWTLCQENIESDLGRRMGVLLGLEEHAYRRLSMWNEDKTMLSVLGTSIWVELVRHTSRAVCPLCLRTSNHNQASWLINALPVCTAHGVWLQDECAASSCRRKLGWSGLGAHRCGDRRCRFDMRKAPTREAKRSEMDGIVALKALLRGEGEAPLGMPVGDAIRMALILGRVAHGFERSTRPPGFIRREQPRIPEIMVSGWRALNDWPDGFVALLDQVRTRAVERAGPTSLRGSFGTFSKKVHEWAREPWGAPIGVAFAQWAADQPDLAATAHVLRRYAPDADLRHRHVSLAEAERLLGVSSLSMRGIATRRDMFVLSPRGEGRPTRLKADAVRDLDRELRGFLSPEEARLALGVGRKVMEQIEAASLVRRVPPEERVMESRPYARQEIDAFVAACVGRGKRLSREAARKQGLTAIIRASASRRTVVDICRALMDGRLSSCATVTEQRGLMRARLRMDEVERALPLGLETLSMEDAAPTIGVRYFHLGIWAERGLLQTVRASRPGERGRRIEPLEWERFRRTYVTGGELAVLARQPHSTWLSRHLRFLGIQPVSGPGIDRCKLCLFKRNEITPQMLRDIRRLTTRKPADPVIRHREAFARVERVAEIVASLWGTELKRVNNRFSDPGSGRLLQIASGRRLDPTGVFRFGMNSRSLSRLKASSDAWVALVPDNAKEFILAAVADVEWRGQTPGDAYTTLRFDGRGRALDMTNSAVLMTTVGKFDPK